MQALRAVHCSYPEAQRVGNVTVLPMLLAAVLPHCSNSQEALVLYVRLLVAPSSSGDAWAQHHLQVDWLQSRHCARQCLVLFFCDIMLFSWERLAPAAPSGKHLGAEIT